MRAAVAVQEPATAILLQHLFYFVARETTALNVAVGDMQVVRPASRILLESTDATRSLWTTLIGQLRD